ncbi:MAG: hypothetical protein ACI9CV_001631 [Ilumatobacter sp.]
MNLILNLVVVAASVLGSGMAFPQARRLMKTRSVEGVSPVWIGVSMAINAWWTAYAITTPLWALLPVSSVSFLLYASIAILYVKTVGVRSLGGMATGAFGLGMVPLPFLLAAGWELAGLAIGLCYGLQLAPAVVAAHRTRALDGVSAGTWNMSFVEALLWLVYGLAVADAALIAGGAAGIVMAGAILLRLALTGHQPFAIVRSRQLGVA